MRSRRVSASIAHVRPIACVSTLMVVFRLVGSKGLVAPLEAASIWSVPGMAKKVAREFGALFEVFGG